MKYELCIMNEEGVLLGQTWGFDTECPGWEDSLADIGNGGTQIVECITDYEESPEMRELREQYERAREVVRQQARQKLNQILTSKKGCLLTTLQLSPEGLKVILDALEKTSKA